MSNLSANMQSGRPSACSKPAGILQLLTFFSMKDTDNSSCKTDDASRVPQNPDYFFPQVLGVGKVTFVSTSRGCMDDTIRFSIRIKSSVLLPLSTSPRQIQQEAMVPTLFFLCETVFVRPHRDQKRKNMH